MNSGDRHVYERMDVTDKDEVNHVLAAFAGAHGGAFDVLLNNAGVAFIDRFEDLTLEQRELVLRGNVHGVALHILRHRPERQARGCCPILFSVCETDSVAPAKATLRHARTAPRS